LSQGGNLRYVAYRYVAYRPEYAAESLIFRPWDFFRKLSQFQNASHF
jgi:hypothetical protein